MSKLTLVSAFKQLKTCCEASENRPAKAPKTWPIQEVLSTRSLKTDRQVSVLHQMSQFFIQRERDTQRPLWSIRSIYPKAPLLGQEKFG